LFFLVVVFWCCCSDQRPDARTGRVCSARVKPETDYEPPPRGRRAQSSLRLIDAVTISKVREEEPVFCFALHQARVYCMSVGGSRGM